MSPVSHRAVLGRCGHRSCRPEKAFNLETFIISWEARAPFPNDEIERLTQEGAISLLWQEVEVVLVGRGFLPTPQQETKKTISDTTLDLKERDISKDGRPIAQPKL